MHFFEERGRPMAAPTYNSRDFRIFERNLHTGRWGHRPLRVLIGSRKNRGIATPVCALVRNDIVIRYTQQKRYRAVPNSLSIIHQPCTHCQRRHAAIV